MEIILSNASDRPIYEQITSQIKEMIMKGLLKPGEPMPSMRKLARDLHVSVITTQRAYDDLARDGFIVTVPENLRRIEKLLSDAAALGRENGLSLNELKATLEVVYADE